MNLFINWQIRPCYTANDFLILFLTVKFVFIIATVYDKVQILMINPLQFGVGESVIGILAT